MKRKSLAECSDAELALILMREVCVGVDVGGHSGRSTEARLIEAAFRLRVPQTLEWTPEYRRDEMHTELDLRASCIEPVQLAIPDLFLLSIEDYWCLCVEKVIELDGYSEIMAGYIDQVKLIAKLLHSAKRFPQGFIEEQVAWQIIYEGGNRALVNSMHNYKHWPYFVE